MRKLLFLLALLIPTTAYAQARVEVTPHVGYRFEGDFDVEAVIFDDVEVEEGESFGLFVDIPLNDSLQIELLANRQESRLIEKQGLFSNEFEVADFDISYYQVGLLFQWNAGQVNPFVVGGIGIADLEPGAPFNEDDQRLSASFGGGLKVFFADHVGLRFEGRVYYVDLDDDNDDDDDRFDRYEDEDSLVQAEATLGLVFAF